MRAPGACAIWVAVLVLGPGVALGQTALPRLYVVWITPEGKEVTGTARPVAGSSHEPFRLRICVQARSVAEVFEQPDIQAVNQHPDYFRQRPGPNITLTVARVTPQGRADVPFRVVSSGLGKDLAVYYVHADVDIVEDKAVRQAKALQFVEWMLAEAQKQGAGSELGRLSAGRAAMADRFEEQYVHNPPGDYEIVARYRPAGGGAHGNGTLVSKPFRVRVAEGPDWFDGLKEKMVRKPQDAAK